MTESSDEANALEEMREKIRLAFPDVVFSGQITPADGESGEEFDEEQALYGALHGKKWSEIPSSFIKSYSYSIPLLTEEAFGIFLPAWLSGALDDQEVRRAVVYAFSPHRRDEDASFMNRRVQPLSGPQKEAIRAFLAHSLDVETSKFVQDHARRALEYVTKFC